MAANDKNWMVTFFYKQDLRSYYMNGLLNAGLNPGIHNANLSIFADAEGIKLYIKKGSTFIFSNNYNIINGVYEKDLSNIGSYLIKCVALNDIEETLVELNAGNSFSARDTALFGTSRQKNHYVIAKLIYNENSITSESIDPVFGLVDKNTNYFNKDTGEESLYYITPGVTSAKDDVYKIPDGSASYFSNLDALKEYSWLCLGSLVETRNNNIDAYVLNSKWVSTPEKWMSNHVFTGRGLAEYRHSLAANTFKESPDIITGANSQDIYLDINNIYEGDVIYTQANKWNDVQGLGHAGPIGKILYSAKLNDYGGSTLEKFTAAKKDLDKKINESKVNNPLIIDAVFLANKKFIANTSNPKESLKNIFNKNNSILNSSDEFNKVTYRWIADASYFGEFDKRFNPYTYTKNFAYSSSSLSNKKIIPLDVCNANLSRLLTIVENKNLIPLIVDCLRQINSEGVTSATQLIPDKATSLIPICLIFRKFKKEDASAETPHWVSEDGFSNALEYNPANILSFFDLQNNATKVNSINFKTEDVFTVLPVIY